MRRVNLILLLIFLLLLIVQLLFPPYYGMDSLSKGRVHTFLGYHPFWKDIPSEEVYNFMLKQGTIVKDSIQAQENLTLDYSRYKSHFNKVRLIANILLLSVLFILLTLFIAKIIKVRGKVAIR